VLGLPLLVVGAILLRRYRPVLWMFIGALLIGLGYLATTGALSDIGGRALAMAGSVPAPKPAAR
jgi:hypothetical protein